MSKTRIIHELHDDFGVTLSEAEKAYDIVVEYIRLRSAIGDHPEDYEPSEYVLVKTSAQPDRKVGKWISKPYVYGAVYCSECDYELRMNNTNYCPNCGLKMEDEG